MLGFAPSRPYIKIMALNMIKLIVGAETLDDYAAWQAQEVVDYYGQAAVPCWTRFMPKRADEILSSEGSLYRVMKSRIVCRSKILGFEMVETKSHGKRCMIMQEPQIYLTVNKPHRPFQGWRYFEGPKAPADKGMYVAGGEVEDPPEELGDELRAAGLL
jgi:hypothetical protein